MRSADTSPPRFRKSELPVKPCVACGRPMSWRKRWARSWDEVKYCSDACRARRTASPAAQADPAHPASHAPTAVDPSTNRRSRRG